MKQQLSMASATPRIHSETSKDSLVIELLFATCTLLHRHYYLLWASWDHAHGLIPRPSTPPVFDCLQYAKTKDDTVRRRPGKEAAILHTKFIL